MAALRLFFTRKIKPSAWQLLLFCALAGAAATLWGYTYADGNQVEQLPLVLRAMDANFLTRDFFTNAFDASSPRYLFAQMVALLARLAPLEAVYLGLTLLGNSLIALVTALTARELFDGDELSGYAAAGAVLAAKTFWLGYSNNLYRNALEPSLLAMPLLFGALLAALRRRGAWTGGLCALAALLHPLMGLETGALLLGMLLAETLLALRFPQRFHRTTPGGWLGGAGLLAAAGLIVLLPGLGQARIPDADFIQILAHLRHPHHYLPGTFDLWQYGQAALFLGAAGAAWWLGAGECRRLAERTPALLMLGGMLALLCLGGYLLVEIIPSRLWVTAQTFRLLYLIKWLGLVWMAGWIGRLAGRLGSGAGVVRWITLTLSLATPASMAVGFAYELLVEINQRPRFGRTLANLRRWREIGLADLSALGLTGGVVWLFQPEGRTLGLLALFSLMLAARFRLKTLAGGLLQAALAAGLVLLLFSAPLPGMSRPLISLGDLSGEESDLAAYMRANTPADALFLVNPSHGLLRITARRALVVDFIAFPFKETSMLEWRQRVVDVYGEAQAGGFARVKQMRDQYTALQDADLLRLQAKYGFEYAVLYRHMPSSFPTLFETESYQIVRMPDPVQAAP